MTRVMRQQNVARLPIDAQELTDILTYVLTLRNQDRGGSAERGRAVFEAKGCGECHQAEEMAQQQAPSLEELKGVATPVGMATAMWNHGRTMLERMTEAGLAWPVFIDQEMIDMLVYVNDLQAAPSKR